MFRSKRVSLAVVLTVVLLAVSASGIQKLHQDDIMQQFMAMEGPYGDVSGFTWKIYDNNYSSNANFPPFGGKIGYRQQFKTIIDKDETHAEAVDSLFRKRMLNLTYEALGREVDLAWITDGGKIEDQLTSFQHNIGLIIAVGGTNDDYSYWKEKYNMIARTAVPMIQDSYMPGYKRSEEYQLIYEDLRKQNVLLCEQFRYWDGQKLAKAFSSVSSSPVRSHGDSIFRVCLGKWKTRYKESLSATPKGRRVRYTWREG